MYLMLPGLNMTNMFNQHSYHVNNFERRGKVIKVKIGTNINIDNKSKH